MTIKEKYTQCEECKARNIPVVETVDDYGTATDLCLPCLKQAVKLLEEYEKAHP